jgi:glycosyltransferase involved in cell wall biosynthesis
MKRERESAYRIGGRPHVCFVAMNLYPVISGSTSIELAGGAEVQQAVLAKALHADGFRVSVLTADHGQADVLDLDGVQVHRVATPGKRGIKGLRFIHPHMTDIVAGLEHIDPDIVYFRAAGFRAAAGAWYARRRAKRFVYACASDLDLQPNEHWIPSRREAFLFRLALRSADGVLLQNVRQRQLLAQHYGKDGVILPNCYMEPEARAATPDGHVLWVGTIKPIKSPERFLELARHYPTTRFMMVGGATNQGDGGQAYYRRIQEMAKGVPNLDFVGYVPFSEVGRHFDGASLLVNTSDAEGFPNTFLQAWIRGVPTLSFVRPEVVSGQTGTIVCPDMDGLVSRVGELTGNREFWKTASAACKAHFDASHSVEVVLQGYRDFFQRLCGQPERWA